MNKRKNLVSNINYKSELIKFFENYKKNFKLDFKIAAHPTTKIKYFGKFKLYKKKHYNWLKMLRLYLFTLQLLYHFQFYIKKNYFYYYK